MPVRQFQQTEQSSDTTTETEAGARLINRRDAIKLLAVSVGALALVGMSLPENAPLPAKWLAPTVETATPTPHAIASWVDGDENGGGDDNDPTGIARDATEQAQTESAYTATEGPSSTDTPTEGPSLTATETETATPTPTRTRTPVPYHTKKPSPTFQPPPPTSCDPATGACQ
jgi:hypothetical protein